jgi:hypothetical protein
MFLHTAIANMTILRQNRRLKGRSIQFRPQVQDACLVCDDVAHPNGGEAWFVQWEAIFRGSPLQKREGQIVLPRAFTSFVDQRAFTCQPDAEKRIDSLFSTSASNL